MTEEVVEEKGKIFVKNLPFGTTRDELIQLFCAIGPLKQVILPRPKVNFTTVYGFITFQEEEDSQKAIQMYNNFVFCNAKGQTCALSIVRAYQKVHRLKNSKNNKQSDKLSSSSLSLWSVDSQESDKASEESEKELIQESYQGIQGATKESQQSFKGSQEVQRGNQNIPTENQHVHKGCQDINKGNQNIQMQSQEIHQGSHETHTLSQESHFQAEKEIHNLEVKLPDPQAEWIKERSVLLQIIEENDRKIAELEKKKGDDMGDEALELKEKQLLEQLQRLPQKIGILKEEIEVLQLQVQLKELQKEQNRLLNH